MVNTSRLFKIVFIYSVIIILFNSCAVCDEESYDGYGIYQNYIDIYLIGNSGVAYNDVQLKEIDYRYEDLINYNSYNSNLYYYPFSDTNTFVLNGPAGNDTIILYDIKYTPVNSTECGVGIQVTKPSIYHTFDSVRLRYFKENNSYELRVYRP